MKIVGVDAVVYGVDDVTAGLKYFDDWGLASAGRGAHGADFTTPSGQTVRVRGSGDADLPKPVEGGSTAREVIWGVDNQATLDAIGAELGRDREVRVDSEGTLHTVDPVGFALGFRKSTQKRAGTTVPGSRMNHPLDPPRRAQPIRIGHVVYNIPRAKAGEAAAFYLDRLQFRLSDRSTGFGEFYRCAGSTDHHNLFLLQGDRALFNHAAFEVSGFDEIIFGGKYMEGQGWKPHTRPGRHILGSNLFWYFKNPCGGQTEYYADMDVMDDNWKPRIWDKHPGFAYWIIE